MPNETRSRTNWVYGTIGDNPLTAGATVLNAANLNHLAVIDTTNHAVIVIDPDRTAGEPEIVLVTAHTALAETATVLRGQLGTSARSHARGTPWEHSSVADDYGAAEQTVAAALALKATDTSVLKITGSQTKTGGLVLAPIVDASVPLVLDHAPTTGTANLLDILGIERAPGAGRYRVFIGWAGSLLSNASITVNGDTSTFPVFIPSKNYMIGAKADLGTGDTNATYVSNRGPAGTDHFHFMEPGDTTYRLKIHGSDARLTWGAGGAAVGDTSLFRSAANTLKASGHIHATAGFDVRASFFGETTGNGPYFAMGTTSITATGGTAAHVRLICKAQPSQSADIQRWVDSSDVVLGRVNKDGYWMTDKVAAPADVDLSNSEVAIWWDPTPLVGGVRYKGKDSAGSILSGSLS